MTFKTGQKLNNQRSWKLSTHRPCVETLKGKLYKKSVLCPKNCNVQPRKSVWVYLSPLPKCGRKIQICALRMLFCLLSQYDEMNTHTLALMWEGCWVPSPPVFFEVSAKTMVNSGIVYAYPIKDSFHIFPEICVPVISGQATRPGKWPYLPKKWCYSSYRFREINMKLPGYYKSITTYKPRISDYLFRWN